MTGRNPLRISALAAILSLAVALPAFAQTSATTDAYGGKQGEVLGIVNTGGQDDIVPPPAAPATDKVPPTRPVERGTPPTPPAPPVAKGELPFTGFEAGLVGLFGALLLGGGFAMRRASRNPS